MSAAKPDLPRKGVSRQAGRYALKRLSVAVATGVVVGVLTLVFGTWQLAPLVGWDAAALVYIVWVWLVVRHQNAEMTARHAVREDPSRSASDVVLILASLASLLAVGLAIATASSESGFIKGLQVAFGVASVVLSWTLVHTVYTLTYARTYYTGKDGGIDFNDSELPTYGDFAYLAFTVGMTFQVSDTTLSTKAMRRLALRQALLSYVFGTVIVATTINLVAGLGK